MDPTKAEASTYAVSQQETPYRQDSVSHVLPLKVLNACAKSCQQYNEMELKGYRHLFDPYTSWKWEFPNAYRKSLTLLTSLWGVDFDVWKANPHSAIRSLHSIATETFLSVNGLATTTIVRNVSAPRITRSHCNRLHLIVGRKGLQIGCSSCWWYLW